MGHEIGNDFLQGQHARRHSISSLRKNDRSFLREDRLRAVLFSSCSRDICIRPLPGSPGCLSVWNPPPGTCASEHEGTGASSSNAGDRSRLAAPPPPGMSSPFRIPSEPAAACPNSPLHSPDPGPGVSCAARKHKTPAFGFPEAGGVRQRWVLTSRPWQP